VAVDGEPDPALLHARNPAAKSVKQRCSVKLKKSIIQAHGTGEFDHATCSCSGVSCSSERDA
jgi:hypothetical protein